MPDQHRTPLSCQQAAFPFCYARNPGRQQNGLPAANPISPFLCLSCTGVPAAIKPTFAAVMKPESSRAWAAHTP